MRRKILSCRHLDVWVVEAGKDFAEANSWLCSLTVTLDV